MPHLPAPIIALLEPFVFLFDPRTWRKSQVLLMGAILAPGKRTVSTALPGLGWPERAVLPSVLGPPLPPGTTLGSNTFVSDTFL